jgi:hypothetical protein
VENKRSVNFHRFGLAWAMQGVGDLCNHVGFTDVAAPRGCLKKKSLDSWLREGAEHIFERKARKN